MTTNIFILNHYRWPKGRRCATKTLLTALSLTFIATITAILCINQITSSAEALSVTAPSDRVIVVKSASTSPGAFKKGKGAFKEVFDKLTIQVKENTPIGSKLADIQTDDQDSQNSQIIYAIVGDVDKQYFSLLVDPNMNKVDLVNQVNFDFESPKKNYQILIRALSPYLRYEVDVDIIVMDENDNKPQLDDFAIVFNNYKNHFPTGPIGRVPATDLDINDQLRYRVLSGNNAQLVVVNETTGDIQLSPFLNSNVPMRAVILVAVSDGINEAVAHMVLTVNLVTEAMLQNSVVLRLDGIGREEFLTKKYDTFLSNVARILGATNMYLSTNIVVFDVEESIQESPPHDSSLTYRAYHGSSIINSTLSVNVSFSARDHGSDVEQYLSSQYIEERIYMNRVHLMQSLDVHVAPFQDNLCVQEPCQNYQDCQATYRFDKAPKTFFTTRNMIFRPIRAVQSYACSCPPTFTGMKHKTECNLQINPCFSNPCMNGGICHRHEAGYSCECKPDFLGARCEHSFANSTCQSISIPSSHSMLHLNEIDLSSGLKQATMCSGKSRCVNSNRAHFYSTGGISGKLTAAGGSAGASPTAASTGGFSCQGCPYPQWSTDLCQLRARSFSKSSYITLPSLRRRHRFHIMLQFATVQNDALLLYNGRYNDKHDFIALEIVDSHLKFSYSLGSSVTTVSLSTIPVSNGNWHKVAIDYRDRNVTLLVDDCDPVIDEALARIQGPQTKRCSNSSYVDGNYANSNSSPIEYRTLDLSSPMQIGALPSLPTEFQVSSQNGFTGCLSDLYIDHQLVDLYNPIHDVGTQLGCPEKRSFCQQQTCNGFPCQDAWGAAKCACGEDYLGKSCEVLISNEKVRKFTGNSYLTFSPIESTITSSWQVSLQFRTINPNGLLMKILLDPEVTILLELYNGGLRLTHRLRNMTFNKINLDNGEWHYVELIWTPELAQLQIDYNQNLNVQSSEMGNIVGSVIKSVTIGASSTPRLSSASAIDSSVVESTDFSTSNAAIGGQNNNDDLANLYGNNYNNGTQSFVGCIYGVNISDNTELWLTSADERNVERGCPVADVCETGACPPNSRCIKKGMNQRQCVCNPGFIGEKCIPVCDLQPCQGENSRCLPVATAQSAPAESIVSTNSLELLQSGAPSYQCECEPLRSGKNCEHQLTPRCPSNWWGRPVAGGNSSICGPCNCDESKGFDGDCDKTTGQCFCKQNYYQPTGSDYCLACDCYMVGSLSASCNQTTGQCKCRPGVVGRRCDTCATSTAEVTLRGCEVIYDACPKTFSNGIWWEKTQPNRWATQPCPASTSTGTASRYCDQKQGWLEPNMFYCISNTFTDLYSQFQVFDNNKFPMTSDLAMKIAVNLRQALNETISNPSLQLYGTDQYVSFRLIHHLIQHESKQMGLNLTHRQDRQYIRNIAESISYILDPAYADNWPEISAISPDGGAEHLLKLIDSYGKVLIESQSDTFTQPFEVATKHFTFGMDTLSTDQLWDLSKTSSFNGPSSPPYATDPFGPPNPATSLEHQAQFNNDGSSVYLDYSSSTKDSSPAIIIPKYDNYALDSANDDTTKALIPLKTLRIKTIQELLPQSYYQAKSRAKREELIIPEFKFVKQQPALVVYSIYKTLGPLLPKYNDNTVQHRLGVFASSNSPVVWLTIRPTNSTEFLNKNIQPKITYMLKMVEPAGRTRPQCAIWDFTAQPNQVSGGGNGGRRNQSSEYVTKQTGRFTTKGCEIKGIHPNHRLRYKYDYVNCSCDHLGAVTVLMDSANYDYLSSEDTNTKDIALIVSLGISLAILLLVLFILSCIRGHSIKSNSNSINKNLIFLLVAIELLILYTILSRSSLNQREYQCKLVAIFLHYFSISLFFWLLVNAIHFYRMLTELRDINHGPMKFYHVLGYAIPAFFVSIAVGLRIEQFGNYLFCWLSIHEPIIWSMFGPISFVSVITIILFLLAFAKSLPVKEDSSGADLVKNHMLINVIKTPLISIFWLVTVYAVNEALTDYIYLYPAIIVTKSVILFVLLCVIDKHIRYNIYVSWLKFRGEKIAFMGEDTMNYNGASTQWIPAPVGGIAGTMNKSYSYGSHNGQITTPGFQSSGMDLYRPETLAFSTNSTTSHSTGTGISSNAAYQHHQSHRIRERPVEDDYGHSRSGRHHRRHKKSSHRRHHHHKHHRHHHHHRSHHHHENDYDHYGNRRRSSKQELESFHSSDGDENRSTSPKRTQIYGTNLSNNSSETNLRNENEIQTVPMEIPTNSNLQQQQQQQQLGSEKIEETAAQ